LILFAVFAERYWETYENARWNGRQIRNACLTALALAEHDFEDAKIKGNVPTVVDRVVLKLVHFKTVATAYRWFIQYIMKIHGVDDHVRAKEYGRRALDRPPTTAGEMSDVLEGALYSGSGLDLFGSGKEDGNEDGDWGWSDASDVENEEQDVDTRPSRKKGKEIAAAAESMAMATTREAKSAQVKPLNGLRQLEARKNARVAKKVRSRK